MVGEIGVDIAEVPVLGRVHAHDRVAFVRYLGRFHLEVMTAAQRRRCLTGINRRLLLAPGAQFPKVGYGGADRTEASGGGLADLERGRQDRVETAGELDRAGALGIETDGRQNR